MSYPYPPAQPQPRPNNGLGTAALVLGILAAIFAFIPLVGVFIATPLALLAVIFGLVGFARTKSGTATNKGSSVAGSVLGVGAGVVMIVMTAATISAVDDASNSQPAAQGTSNQNGQSSGNDQDDGAQPDTVVFRVTGDGQPNITYMTDSDQHSGNQEKNQYGMGYAELPWEESMPMDGEALFYAVNAQLGQDGGEITCEVVIGGEFVADGSASGAHQICQAQANQDAFGG